jgi:hypothetical protein
MAWGEPRPSIQFTDSSLISTQIEHLITAPNHANPLNNANYPNNVNPLNHVNFLNPPSYSTQIEKIVPIAGLDFICFIERVSISFQCPLAVNGI